MMKKDLVISVYEIVGSPMCVASNDGQKIFDRLSAAFKEDRDVSLSFRNIKMLTSAFLNAAIGQLYGTFTEEKIRSLLQVQDMESDDLVLLKRVVDTAKQYFKDPNKFHQAVRDVLEGENDDTQSRKC